MDKCNSRIADAELPKSVFEISEIVNNDIS